MQFAVDMVSAVGDASDMVISDLAPSGVLRAAINLGNPVLAQGTANAPAGRDGGHCPRARGAPIGFR